MKVKEIDTVYSNGTVVAKFYNSIEQLRSLFGTIFFITGGGITQRKSVEAAIAEVKSLLADGWSAYRDGFKVFIDDGGYDWGH